MRIGSGKCEIAFPEGFLPTEGFTVQAHPLFVRALIVGDTDPFILVSIEMTSLTDAMCIYLKAVVLSEVMVEDTQIWITVTHTFSAPHLLPDEAMHTERDRENKEILFSSLKTAVLTAVREAWKNRKESKLTVHTGLTSVLASRDIELPEGWWVGCQGKGESDKTLRVLKVTSGDTVTALVLHAHVQSSVLDGTGARDGKCVSSDLAGLACRSLENAYPSANVMFLIGAAGDQAPVEKANGFLPDGEGGWRETDLHEAGIEIAERLGSTLAAEASKVLEGDGIEITGIPEVRTKLIFCPAKKMNRDLHSLRPSRTAVWEEDDENDQTLEVLSLGDLAILGVRPELTVRTLHQLEHASQFPVTLVCTMVNGGAKYMADHLAYERVMYEAVNSPFAEGAAEQLVEAASNMLRKA